MFVIRQIHKYLGISVAVLLLISAVTGFLRANYVWYWKPGYKQHKHPITEDSRYIQAPGIGISELETIIVKKEELQKSKASSFLIFVEDCFIKFTQIMVCLW